MFTDKDWNVPRRITVVALNDDVDEPTEIRTIYHTAGSCHGTNHNTDQPCIEDPMYSGINITTIDVVIADDDIADLVVICDGLYDGSGAPVDIDEAFIGSYDAAGPMPYMWANYTPTYSAADFDGSYGSDFDGSGSWGDSGSGSLQVNYWYEEFERVGPNAEDGILITGTYVWDRAD